MTPLLTVEALSFDEELRHKWRNKDFVFLQESAASAAIRDTLIRKATVRPKRFFGEAYTASVKPHENGFYCPFKWLTNATWSDPGRPAAQDAAAFKTALLKYFPKLRSFQER